MGPVLHAFPGDGRRQGWDGGLWQVAGIVTHMQDARLGGSTWAGGEKGAYQLHG